MHGSLPHFKNPYLIELIINGHAQSQKIHDTCVELIGPKKSELQMTGMHVTELA